MAPMWITEADVGDDAAAEEGVLRTAAGPVEVLRRQDDVARFVLLLQASDCGHADDPAHIQGAKRVDIRPVIQLVREDAMTASVSGEKIDLPACKFAAEDDVGWRAKGCVDGVLGGVGERLHLVKATATDDPDCWFLHGRGE
jgi:hypothetical protein